MATALTHSFTRKADTLMSTAAQQRYGEPWDIFPDPKDPLEQRADEGRAEFGVFGPMPSNPAKRARYMLLANYLEMAGSGATIGGASEREKREEEQHFERSVYAQTIRQIDERLFQVNEEIARIDIRLADVRREIQQHRLALSALRGERDATQQKIEDLTKATDVKAATVDSTLQKMKEEAAEHAGARNEIQEKIRLAEEKFKKERDEFCKENGLEFDPVKHRYFEVREDGTRREFSVFAHPEIMGSRAYLEMQRAGLEMADLKQQAGELEKTFIDRRKLEERFLEATRASMESNAAKIAELRKLVEQQTQAIQLEEEKIKQLQVTEAQLVKEHEALDVKKTELQQTRIKISELQEQNIMIRDNLTLATKIRDSVHTDRLALFAKDQVKLDQENDAYKKYQTAYAGICSVDQLPDLTGSFNDLQKAVAQNNAATGSKGPGTVAPDQALAAAAVDPVNGDASANAKSVADAEKPAEQKQEQVAEATAADQPGVTPDGSIPAQPQQQKKTFANTNTGMG